MVQLSIDETRAPNYHYETGSLSSVLYVLGLRREGEKISFPVQGFDGGSVSMLAVKIG